MSLEDPHCFSDPFAPTDWTIASSPQVAHDHHGRECTLLEAWHDTASGAGPEGDNFTPSIFGSSYAKLNSSYTPFLMAESSDYFITSPGVLSRSHDSQPAAAERLRLDTEEVDDGGLWFNPWRRRRRAMSSPAIQTSSGRSSPFPMFQMAIDAKRPKYQNCDSSAGLSFSHETTSPESPNVLTPPDEDLLVGPYEPECIGKVAPIGSLSPQAELSTGLQARLPSSTLGYQQFVFPSGKSPWSREPFLYELDAERQRPKTTNDASGCKNKTAASHGLPSESTAAFQISEEDDGLDEEARRAAFLERNRLAAVKSRRRKKEHVHLLESSAADLCKSNHALQAIALSLRQELLALRSRLDDHGEGCECEHVRGYRFREQGGGGIPVIEALARKTLHLDYSPSKAPTMGSEDDVYALNNLEPSGARPSRRWSSSTKLSEPAKASRHRAKHSSVSVSHQSSKGTEGRHKPPLQALSVADVGTSREAINMDRSGPSRSTSAPPTTPSFIEKSDYFA